MLSSIIVRLFFILDVSSVLCYVNVFSSSVLRREHPNRSLNRIPLNSLLTLEQSFWISPEGLNIEVLYSPGIKNNTRDDLPWYISVYSQVVQLVNKQKHEEIKLKPPLLFVHGSFHGAWCWAENFFEFFNNLGYDCYAHSLRGTSNTGVPPGFRLPSIRIESHVGDLEYVLKRLADENPDRPPPILIAHSFGGVIIMKLLEKLSNRQSVTAAAWLCSVPPSGNGPMTARFIQSRFVDSLEITWGFVLKAATTRLDTCRKLFFDDSVRVEDLQRFMRNFLADSRVGLDVMNLGPVLPSVSADPKTGRATWLEDPLTSPISADPDTDKTTATTMTTATATTQTNDNIPTESSLSEETVVPIPPVEAVRRGLPRLVIGAEKDFIIDDQGVRETAAFLGVTPPVVLPGLPHDVMLVPGWRLAATALSEWLQSVETLGREGGGEGA